MNYINKRIMYLLLPPNFSSNSTLKNSHWLSLRLATFSILGVQLRGSLKPQYDTAVMYGEFYRSPQLGSNETERWQSLGQLYVWSLLFFQIRYNFIRIFLQQMGSVCIRNSLQRQQCIFFTELGYIYCICILYIYLLWRIDFRDTM